MCLAHEGEPYGYLSDKTGPLTIKYMASRCIISASSFLKSVAELVSHGCIMQLECGSLFIARMVEDERVRLLRAAGGIKGGNPNLKEEVNHKVNLTSNLKPAREGYPPSDVRARASYPESESESNTDSKPTATTALPMLSQSEYPLTLAELQRKDPAADPMFVLRLVQESTQKLLSNPKFPQEKVGRATTDMIISKACKESFSTGPPGHGLGLLLSRVPYILTNWGMR